MKEKIVCLVVLLWVINSIVRAGEPRMDGYSFTYNGQTLDFYSTEVIYKASSSPVSRRGEYSIGGKAQNIVRSVGEEKRNITILLYVGERTSQLEGVVSFQYQNGEVNYLILEGNEWKCIISPFD